MSAAADRRIAELEEQVKRLQKECASNLAAWQQAHEEVELLEAKLVQRDVYEAEQCLPPEHAVLIKHLATVEKCIDRGSIQSEGYYDQDICTFCECDTYWDSHNRDCPWLVLQLERGVTSVIDDINLAALRQHQHRERQRKPREPARPGATLQNVNDLFKEIYRTPDLRHPTTGMTATEALVRRQQHVHMTENQTAELGAAIHRDLERFYQRAAPPVIVDRSVLMLNLFPQAFNPATLPAHEVHSDSGQQGQPGGESRREEHEEGDPALHHRPDDEQR